MSRKFLWDWGELVAMQFRGTLLKGCFIVESGIFCDERGSFIKIYHDEIFDELGVSLNIKEQFLTVSKNNVLRGMHFQLPPHDHAKLVTCVSGSILDVVLDLRKDSKTYGTSVSFNLSADKLNSVLIPKGMAHGFLSLEENSCVLYSTTSVHAPEMDGGIYWDSLDFKWPTESPIVSKRDEALPYFSNFESPF
jgi:dTDP-4-dehydrorhamnose 3,5-epimerase